VDSTAPLTCGKGMALLSSPSSCGKHPRLQAPGQRGTCRPAGHLLPKLPFDYRRQGPQQNLERKHGLLRRLDKCAAWKELRTTRPKQHHCQPPHELPAFKPTEHAQQMAGHESPRTTKLYDRTKDEITLSEVERMRYRPNQSKSRNSPRGERPRAGSVRVHTADSTRNNRRLRIFAIWR
jgi:hypothetical protein